MGVYRDRLQIIADILLIASKRSRRTQIMYQANLSYRLLCRYVEELVGADLIACENRDFFVLTDKGKTFLDQYETYSKLQRHMRERSHRLEKEKAFLESMSCSQNHFHDYLEKNPRKDGKRRRNA